jgi:hypothetical protein
VAQLVLGVTGAAAAPFIGLPPSVGFAVGSAIGGYVDRDVIGLYGGPPNLEGPRLEDLKIQVSSYGNAVKQLWGTMRIAGNIIWAQDIQERRQTVQGDKNEPDVTTYSYYGTFAIGICEGPIQGIIKMWANTDLIANWSDNNTEIVQIEGLQYRLYLGSETQPADYTIEEYEGEGEVPGHRGMAYIVFNDSHSQLYIRGRQGCHRDCAKRGD